MDGPKFPIQRLQTERTASFAQGFGQVRQGNGNKSCPNRSVAPHPKGKAEFWQQRVMSDENNGSNAVLADGGDKVICVGAGRATGRMAAVLHLGAASFGAGCKFPMHPFCELAEKNSSDEPRRRNYELHLQRLNIGRNGIENRQDEYGDI